MPDNRKYYVISEDNCKFESLTKEEIYAAIVQAIEGHQITDVNTGFVTTLKEKNNNSGLSIWIGTTAQYNAIDPKENNCLYILSDDTELEDLETTISNLNEAVENLGDQCGELQNNLDILSTNVSMALEEITDRLDYSYSAKTIYYNNGTEIPYGNNLDITLNNPVTPYRLFRVYAQRNGMLIQSNVLCLLNGGYIEGVGNAIANNNSSTVQQQFNISLYIDNGKITKNLSTASILQNWQDSVDLEMDTVKIIRIDALI